MCTIMAYKGRDIPEDIFKKGLDKTVSRGPDDTRIVKIDDVILGFQRLAIMGLTPEGMQPFELDGDYAICNGELYGFRLDRTELRWKGYEFKSESDCEIILPSRSPLSVFIPSFIVA